MKTQSAIRTALIIALRVGLVGSIALVVWRVSGNLSDEVSRGEMSAADTEVEIVFRGISSTTDRGSRIEVSLLPIDVNAAWREFRSEARPGVRFEDFVEARLHGREKVTASIDANGRTLMTVPKGRWFVHAILPGQDEIEWMLPVEVGGKHQLIELNLANAYARSRRF